MLCMYSAHNAYTCMCIHTVYSICMCTCIISWWHHVMPRSHLGDGFWRFWTDFWSQKNDQKRAKTVIFVPKGIWARNTRKPQNTHILYHAYDMYKEWRVIYHVCINTPNMLFLAILGVLGCLCCLRMNIASSMLASMTCHFWWWHVMMWYPW